MTSPIWPVILKPPLPFILLASMKRMSPPAGVQGQADRNAGALDALSHFSFHADLNLAEEFLEDLAGDDEFFRLALDHAARLLAADGADDLLELAHAGFARVVAHDVADGFLGELDLLLSR